jgi:hypothetical protein
MATKVARKFDPEWDLVYLLNREHYQYCVIKKPEAIPGEDYDKVYVREGCTVYEDGRWYYWRLRKPVEYEEWKAMGPWADVNDKEEYSPDFIFTNRINRGRGTVGFPAPKFVGRDGNNWVRGHPLEVPNHIDSDILGDLILAHLMLSEYLQDGVEDPKKAK